MLSARFKRSAFITLAFSGAASMLAQTSVLVRPQPRINTRVDNALRTRVLASHPLQLDSANIGARVATGTRFQHLHLVLNSSADQEAALQQLMAEQQDKSSANFHKWLSPDEFGQRFGAASTDLAKVSAWLQDQGLQVESISKSGRVISFAGTAAQLEAAFQTEIHAVTINGQAHVSNTTDISIPAAFAPVVAGVARLNDIFPSKSPQAPKTVQIDALQAQGIATPTYGTATGTHYVTPGDAAVIYNTTPLTSNNIDGTGQTIAVLAQSNIDVADVEKFRSMFGLKKNDPTITVVGQDPGTNQDDTEAFLDAEWSGAMATGAAVNFIVSAPSLEGGGIDGAALYAVENNAGDIISLSYGGGETSNGASGTAFWNQLWEQAAAQGQTVFVSTGDSGAATCDSSSASYATHGYCVNALGSSAYNVAVGGSMFVDYGSSQFWGANGTAIPFTNALSYIPEAALNQGRLSTTLLNSASTSTSTGSGIFSDGGGISIYTARPAWQTGSGIPTNTDAIAVYSGTGIAAGSPITGLHRLVPDIVNISAYGHDGTLFCAGSICATSATAGLSDAGIVGGTSVATPVQASLQALINQKNGGRQGNILPTLYALANQQYTSSTTACQAVNGTSTNTAVTLPASTCFFHDIVSGSNIVATASSGTAGIGFYAQPGYDEATGLGSINTANLANSWNTVGLTATTTTFTLSPTIIKHGATQNLNATVTSASGTPTGDVSLIAETSNPGTVRSYKLTAGNFSGAVASSTTATDAGTVNAALPGGTYNVHVHYAGDTTFAASDSASIPVTVSKEDSTISSSGYNVTTGGSVIPTTSYAYGASIYLDTFVNPASGNGLPTGTVTYTVALNGATIGSFAQNLDAQGNSYFYAGQNFPNFYLKANYPALAPGSYIVTATYSGDNSFNTSSTTTAFTVSRLTPTVTLSVPATITSGASTTLSLTIANPSTTANPNSTVLATGTVNFTDTTTSTPLGSCTLASATCSITTSAITGTGTHIISAAYSGDANYAPATPTSGTSLSGGTATTTTLSITGTLTVGVLDSLKATVSPTTATGTVAFYDGATYLGRATVTSGVATFSVGTSAGGGTLTAGSHNFSAVYSGDTADVSSTGTLTSTIAKSATAITIGGPSAAIYGQNIILSASLSRANNGSSGTTPWGLPPTGTVTFYDNGVSVGTGTLSFDPSGYLTYVAAVTLSNIPAGSHTFSATFNGDNNYNSSTTTTGTNASTNILTTVSPLTPIITVSAPQTVYTSAATVPLTAFIPAAGNLAVPTGMVSFYDGPTLLGTASFTYSAAAGGFTATYNATLSTGTHSITATLASDPNYNTANSAVFTVSILKNNIWIVNANATLSELSQTGSAITPSGVSGGGKGIAIDGSGSIWSLNSSGSSLAEFSSAGSIIHSSITGGGINTPTALAIDGQGYIWVTNGNNTLSVINSTTGAPVSSTPYTSTLSTPTTVNVDASGNLWITNAGDNSVTEVIGVAAPVATPQTTAVTNNSLAARP